MKIGEHQKTKGRGKRSVSREKKEDSGGTVAQTKDLPTATESA